MSNGLKLERWVEYSLCEWALEVYPKSKSKSATFNSFCERLKESIINDNLSIRDKNVLNYISYNANRIFSLNDNDIGEMCANFFINNRWSRYVKAIKYMEKVNWEL
tara:strand:- start:65 stop:382 length:318 start_codon:yes stop_codon:yes gene_type:complete